jgi:formate hydrogenlyase transcriptional activator
VAQVEFPGLSTAILDAIGDAIMAVDRTGCITFVNDRAAALLGYRREDLVGQPVEILIPERLREAHARHRLDYAEVPEPRPTGAGRELVAVRRDGTELNVEIGLGSITVDGELQVICSLHDITRLREREDRIQQLVNAMPGVFYVFDSDGRLTWWNQNLERVLGYTAEELEGRQVLDFIHPDDHEHVASQIGLLFADGQSRTAEYRLLLKDGSTIPYAGNGALFEIGGEQHMVGLTIDASTLRETEHQLQERIAEIDELRRRLELENTYLRAEVGLAHHHGNIVGDSRAIRAVLAQVEQVAATESTVLLLGETGTGKELIAQRLHELSPRSGRAMVKVNCAALPSTLMESELFGREKGAYTGAVARELGRFEIADGSTLFLDEVGELPLELQSKLLRVLQDGQFERVGSSRTHTTDVRIIAATNRDLAEAVREGRFRQDLYYRLNVFPIRVPPLRERREDVPLLVWSFVETLGRDMGVTIDTISQRTMDRLQNHPWPGNVRELRNVVERSMIVSRGRTLDLALPEADESVGGESLTLDEVQRRHIRGILELTGGKISGRGGAAEILGLKPTTLRSRMERLGMDPKGGALTK